MGYLVLPDSERFKVLSGWMCRYVCCGWVSIRCCESACLVEHSENRKPFFSGDGRI